MSEKSVSGYCLSLFFLVFCAVTAIASRAQTFNTLANFDGTDGDAPYAGLVQGTDGNFYGTATAGGSSTNCTGGCGTVFKITPEGVLTAIYSFSFTDGASPQGGLIQANDGNFYGTTSGGGSNINCSGSCGTIFKITPDGTLTTLYSFSWTDGAGPQGRLIQATDGNFYGTTSGGGSSANCSSSCGTVFKITADGTLTTLHSFNGTDGGHPSAGLVQGSDGNFYGTTVSGGSPSCSRDSIPSGVGCGTVFKITPDGTLTTLYNFSGTDGAGPQGGLILATDGNFYGTASSGGTIINNNCSSGCGTVFKITADGALTTLHSFSGTDGAAPSGGLVQGTDGSLYGTALGSSFYKGLIFKITTEGTVTPLHLFTGTGNVLSASFGALVQGTDGNLYGTTKYDVDDSQNCDDSCGTVFSLSLTTGGPTTTTLVSSVNPSAIGETVTLTATVVGQVGGTPTGTVTFINGANTMGTVTLSGGQATFNKTFVSTGTKSITAAYSGDSTYSPSASPILLEGIGGVSTVTTLTSIWNPTTVGQPVTFTASVSSVSGTPTGTVTFMNGTSTIGTVVLSGDQATFNKIFVSPGVKSITAIYSGDTNFGSSSGALIQTVATTSVAPPTLRTLVNFYDTYGAIPDAGLVQGSDGNFYGTTSEGGNSRNCKNFYPTKGCGTVFKITPKGVVTTPLYSFSGPDGQDPQAGLVQGIDGTFYGTTEYGGNGTGCTSSPTTAGCGTVFKITPRGTLTTLHNFGSEAFFPTTTLVEGSDGNFYGTTLSGGANTSTGTIFRITPEGSLAVLHVFTGTDGGSPSGLVQGGDGNFYGTTASGGINGLGTVFKITPSGTLTTLYDFSGPDGAAPSAGLVQGNDGNLYGTTAQGGADASFFCDSCGTVFKITPEGALTTLHNFIGDDGWEPLAGLAQGNDGNFYGTTSNGGTNSDPHGTLFRITPDGTFTLLYSFCGAQCTNGSIPVTGLVEGADGNLYGATSLGGLYGDGEIHDGTVFSLPLGIGAESTPTVVSSVNPSEVNQNVVFTATVVGYNGGTPTGTVTFTDGSNTIGPVTLSGGQASFSEIFPSWGTRLITAAYSGDSAFGGSTSIPLGQRIFQGTTTTTLVSSLNPSTVGQPVTFTATVTPQFGGTPTGTVTFMNGTVVMGTVTLSAGQASFNRSFPAAGSKSITAIYSGDGNFTTSTSPALSQLVNQATTTTTLVSSLNPSTVGQPVTFTATVMPQFGGTPTGTVTFMNGTVVMGAVTLSAGEASFNRSFPATGSKSISAIYSGDTNFETSSGALTQTVQ